MTIVSLCMFMYVPHLFGEVLKEPAGIFRFVNQVSA